jgi:hypothetical protein
MTSRTTVILAQILAHERARLDLLIGPSGSGRLGNCGSLYDDVGRLLVISVVYSGRENGVCVNPFAGRRFAIRRWTLQAQSVMRADQFDYLNLPATDSLVATLTDPNVVKRMPEMEFVEPPKRIDLVVGGQSQR